MTQEEIIEVIGEREPWGKKEWVSLERLAQIKNCIIYGDDGGDLFLKEADDKNELKNKLLKHLDGDTNCDFETRIYLIICEGKKAKVSDILH